MKIKNWKKILTVGFFFGAAALAASVFADATWAADFAANAKEANTNGWRKGVGVGICPIKTAILLVVYLSWLASTSWINNDAERLGDPDRSYWNGLNLGVFGGAFVVSLFLPIFWIGLPIVVLAWLVPAFTYVGARNKELLDADKVMTPGHLTFWFRTKVLKQKVKPKKLAYEGGSAVQLEGWQKEGADSQTLTGRTFRARSLNNSVGYNLLRELLYHAMHARATEVLVEFGAEETKFQYMLDGIFHPASDAFKRPWTREEADCVAEATKYLFGGKPEDRRSRQGGTFKMLYDKNKKGKPNTCAVEVVTGGTPNGEAFKFAFVFDSVPFKTLDQLGVAPERQEKMRALLNSERGLVVLATAPHQGLKTLTTVAFNSADRFTRDFATVEDVNRPYEVVENIPLTTYDSKKGETPATILPDVFFKEPKVLLIRDMGGLESWKICCEEIKNDRLIISTARAKDSVGALIAILKAGVDKKDFADSVTAIIAQKLVRRLCEECKEEYQPTPQVLQSLGLDPKTEKLWRRRVHEPVEPGERDYYVPCEACREIGYQGRVAIFDFLEINDEMRQIIAADADLVAKDRALRRAALKSGQRGFLVDGARLVRKGITSVDELARCLK